LELLARLRRVDEVTRAGVSQRDDRQSDLRRQVGALQRLTHQRVARGDRDLRSAHAGVASPYHRVEEVEERRPQDAVPGVPGLSALDIDPEQAAEGYRERVLAPYRSTWAQPQIEALREQLSGACTVEIAAFDEPAGMLAGDDPRFDHILFDTAPTGHTLRLLSLPRAWSEFLETNTRGASCLGPHSGFKTRQDRFALARDALIDGAKTTVVLVTRPDRAALREAARTAQELDLLAIRNQELVINAIFTASSRDDAVAVALEARGRAALEDMPERLRAMPTARLPLRGFNMVGLPALRALLTDRDPPDARVEPTSPPETTAMSLAQLVDALASDGHGLVMVMGKGGVGKTTIACAIAIELASRGLGVHLSTTDPAAHVASTLMTEVPNLHVSRIDPAVETKAYTDRLMRVRGKDLDEEGRALLAEDLRSPCNEEVAVFGAFSRLVSEARRSFVVLDTAPTGHTLLLLDATGAYDRQIHHELEDKKVSSVVTPLARLRDPQHTKVVLVTLAETTPVTEAADLQADLRRAQIEPFAWVINGSLAATATRDPLLARRIAAERVQIARVERDHAQRVAIVPWSIEEPVGAARLRALVTGARA